MELCAVIDADGALPSTLLFICR